MNMVAVVSGNGIGLERSSLKVLGSVGQVGDAGFGRAGDSLYVNSYNGNVVLQRTDDVLIGRGLDDVIARTYNSRAELSVQGGDGWQFSFARRLTAINAGVSIRRIAADGSDVLFNWDSVSSSYISKEGGGAYDKITVVGSGSTATYTWTDGDTQVSDVYNGTGVLQSSKDLDGNVVTFTYNTFSTVITTANGDSTTVNYSAGGKVTSIATSYTAGTVKTHTRVSYAYDTYGRLYSVATDLSPENGADNLYYYTTYAYVSTTSNRIASITQADGSRIDITYRPDNLVESIAQTSASGVTRTTAFQYNTFTHLFYATNAASDLTTIYADNNGQLTSVATAANQLTTIAYKTDGSGDVASITDARNGQSTYSTDSATGNVTTERDALGNTIDRTYGPRNQLLTETRYLVPDPDAIATGASATTPLTTRFVWQEQSTNSGFLRLRFTISPAGRVTEHTYNNTNGQKVTSIEYRAAGDIYTGTLFDYPTLAAWSAAAGRDRTQTALVDYQYDSRGNVTVKTAYGTVSSTGAGQPHTDVTWDIYSYDSAGHVLTHTAKDLTTTESFTYDGLGRVTQSVDFSNNTITTAINDSTQTTVVSKGAMTEVSLYNLAGELITVSRNTGGSTLEQTSYKYDSLGRLRMMITANGFVGGLKTYFVYDKAGRKVADISDDGSVVEYAYDKNDNLVSSVRRQNRLTSTQLASLVDASGNPTMVDPNTLHPSAGTADRWEWRIYDAADRLVQTIDAAGATTVMAYDGASRLLSTTAYSNMIASATVSGYKLSPPTAPVSVTADASKDRTTRLYYDSDGNLIGTLDAEGGLTENRYDGAGLKIRTIQYATPVSAAATFAQMVTAAGTNTSDIHSYFLYDNRGLLGATIDGEGDVTRYFYTGFQQLIQVTRGQTVSLGSLSASPKLTDLPAATGTLDTTTYTRDGYGRVLTETNLLAGGTGEITTNTYDALGNLTRSSKTSGSNVRTDSRRYDGLGRLIGELSGEGSVQLAALGASPTQAAIDDVYKTWGTTYGYDGTGRLVRKTESNGSTNAALSTTYYYNSNDKLAFEVNAAGEVTEYVYSGTGDLTDTIRHTGARLSPAVVSSLGGGQADVNFMSLIPGVTSATLDSTTHVDFNATGTVAQMKDPLNNAIVYSYNAFRELTARVDPIAASTTVQTSRTYDRRGLVATEVVDSVAGLNISALFGYDAFGRLKQVTDGENRVRKTDYDRAGRVVLTTDATNKTVSYEYDGRSNVTKITDRSGRITTIQYDAFNRNVLSTFGGGVTSATVTNGFANVVSVTATDGRQVSYTYDLDGNLKTVTQGGVLIETRNYDKAGRLGDATEGTVKTAYAYDAANRVLTETVNPGGLALVTTYEYDPQGRRTKITDPSNVVTTLTFDQNGRTTTRTVGSAGTALTTTTYTYDQSNQVLTVTEGTGGAATVTKYTYDKAGRLSETAVDPTGLNLRTTYLYDKAGNVLRKEDAAGGVTRYAYDGENRVTWTVDPELGVTRTFYDGEGRITGTYAYTGKLSTASIGWGLTETNIVGWLPAVQTSTDVVTNYAYDLAGRLRFTIDGFNQATEYVVDDSGNITKTVQYATPVTAQANGAYNYQTLRTQVDAAGFKIASDRASFAFYDSANRMVYSVNAAGDVAAYTYDANRNVISSTVYANQWTSASDPTYSPLSLWTADGADRISRTVYDAAGRVQYSADAENYVTKFDYDAGGRVSKQTRYFNPVALSTTPPSAVVANAAKDVVLQFFYDAAGRLVESWDGEGFKTRLTLDSLGQITDTIQGYQSNQSTTHRVFDKAGRVISETRAADAGDPDATTTTYAYDGVGRATDITVASGTSAASTTHRVYKANGAVFTETQGYGTAEASTTEYGYDGIGRTTTVKDGRAFTVTRVYDRLSRVISETVPLNGSANAVTTRVYDAYGNLVKLTDPKLNTGTFAYDKLNRLILQGDPLLGGTAYTYTKGGEVSSVRRFANPITLNGAGLPVAPAQVAADSVTSFSRDKLDRLNGVTDARGFSESYTLDAFGNRTVVTNKLGGVTTNTYDRRGLLTSESIAITGLRSDNITSAATTIVNSFGYDARGNRTSMIEAQGQTEQRTTTYAYDRLDRLVSKTGDTVPVVATDLTSTTTAVPGETYKYDGRGNLIETKTAGGARTLSWYDDLGRKTKELNALGTLSSWTYDANGNVLTSRVYGDLVALPAVAGGAEPSPVIGSNYRETLYTYDFNNRLTQTKVVGLRVGLIDINGNYGTAIADVVNTMEYDLAGNVVRETDGRGATVYSYYDKLGRKAGQIDQENYLTVWNRDADGNLWTEMRYANKFVGTPPLGGAVPTTITADSTNDRLTTFGYDKMGNRTSETRANVLAWSVDSNGLLTGGAVPGNATISYEYNALGLVTKKTEATLEFSDYGYDSSGRQIWTKAAQYTDVDGAGVRSPTDTFYDRLGNVQSTRERSKTGAAGDQVTSYTYGAGGRLTSMTDASGFVRSYQYDADGHVLKESYTRVKSDGSSVTEAVGYRYDLLGRLVTQAAATWNGTGWTFGDATRIRYNAYGEMSGRGITAGPNDTAVYQETFDYDNGGRMFRSNSGDGSTRIYFYDYSGRVTLTVNAAGSTDLASYTTETILPVLTVNGAYNVGDVYVASVAPTITIYDKRGLAIGTREPQREINTSGTRPTITTSRTYNAWGEVTSETDALGFTTTYSYDTAGSLTGKKAPFAAYTDALGTIHTSANTATAPSESYYHDVSGRLVGLTDANGSTTTRNLLAGTGYGDEALVTAEFDAEGGIARRAFDEFGDLRKTTDQTSRVTLYAYDKAGRLTELTHAGGLVDHYVYDGLGQRTQHWNSQFGSTYKELTDYDRSGRVVLTTDFENRLTGYAYQWQASLATSGLGTFGGWVKTTTTAMYKSAGVKRTATESTDYFGREVGRSDLGDHVHARTFDKAGRAIGETVSITIGDTTTQLQSIAYSWYNSGRLSGIDEGPPGGISKAYRYSYDAAGNRLTETMSRTSGGTTTTLRSATASWDELGRMVAFFDTAAANTHSTYEYDAAGNVRHIVAFYNGVANDGSWTGAGKSQDYWYLYDKMNRVTTTMGQLKYPSTRGSGIERGTTGTDLTWDKAGRRTSATTTATVSLATTDPDGPTTWEYQPADRREYYLYNADGDLEFERLFQPSWTSTTAPTDPYSAKPMYHHIRDAMGRETSTETLSATGAVVATSTRTFDKSSLLLAESFTQGYTRTTTYNYSDSTGYQGAVVTTVVATTNNSPSVPTTERKATYVWWDTAELATVAFKPDQSLTPTNNSTYSYDGSGHIVSVSIADGAARTVSFLTDASGRILERHEASSGTVKPHDNYVYFGDKIIGSVSNQVANTMTGFRDADFDQNYVPISASDLDAPSSYTVRDNDTLRSVALAVWGDANLWYMLAEANGLDGSEILVTGQSLIVPANVTNIHNNDETFAVYDPNKAMGANDPTTMAQIAPPAKKHGGCGIVGKILIIAIAVAITVILKVPVTNLIAWGSAAPATFASAGAAAAAAGAGATIAGAAIAGAVGSVVSQAVGVATGVQDKFSWKGVAISALSAGVSAGVGASGVFQGIKSTFLQGAAQQAASNAITQGVAVATGLQKKFDWAGVAVAGVVGGVSAFVDSRLPEGAQYSHGVLIGAASVGHEAATALASEVAGAATRSLLTGSSFSKNLMAVLPDVIGSTIGNSVANAVRAEAGGVGEARRQLQAIAQHDADIDAGDGPRRTVGIDEISRDQAKAYRAEEKALLRLNERNPHLTSAVVFRQAVELQARWSSHPDLVRRAAGLTKEYVQMEPGAADASTHARFEGWTPPAVITAGALPVYIHETVDGLAERADVIAQNVQAKIGEYPLVGYALTALDIGFKLAGGLPRAAMSVAWDQLAGKAQDLAVEAMTRGAEAAGYKEDPAASIARGLLILGTLVFTGATAALAIVKGVSYLKARRSERTEAPEPPNGPDPKVPSFNFRSLPGISPQKQAKHIKGTPEWARDKKGYFTSMEDAEEVLAAARAGNVEFRGLDKKGDPIIEYQGVTGYNNNELKGYFDQATHVFVIKIAKDNVHLFPADPNKVGR
jgi:YD repeat-containing protein